MPPVTLFLIVANVLAFMLQLSVPGIETPFALWPLAAAQASGGHVSFQVWQLVTYSFLHGGIWHIGLNMFALYMFGAPMERVFGPGRYLTYYFVCVLSAAIAQLITSTLTGALYPTLGASGGVFGLLLAYAMYFPHNRIMLIFPPIPMPARIFVIVYAAIELFMGVTGTQENVAHFAHLGGLVGGYLMLKFGRGAPASWRR
jgi:membrane associated rhomboid family serine protease